MLNICLARASAAGVVLVTSVMLSSSCFAQAPAAKKAGKSDLVITSDTLTYDYEKKFAIFQGHVVVSDPTMKMIGDKMTVYFGLENSIETIVAVGHVVIKQVGKTAKGDKASYSADQEVLVLTGVPATIASASGTATGKKITYWINEDRVVIDRATMTLPSKGQTNILGTK